MQNKKVPPASEIRSTFHKIYYKDIAPIMAKYEKKRQFEWFKIFIIEAILITLLIIGLKFFWSNLMFRTVSPELAFFCILANFIFLGGIMGVPTVKNNNFAKMLKASCMNNVVSAFGNMKWGSIIGKGISDSQLVESELFSTFNRRSNDDIFEGTFKDVNYTILETDLSYVSSSGQRSSVRPVFKGVIINFDANKTIKNKTIIVTKDDTNIKNRSWSLLSLIAVLICLPLGIYLKDMEVCFNGVLGLISFIIAIYCEKTNKNKEVLNEIKLEDSEFNKKYKAYSSDEVEGRYLITTAFMERFKNLQTAFGARGVKCSFYGESLMFAISTNKNLFEIGNLFTPLNSPKQLDVFFNELISILAFIDYFKLDEKTGL